MTPPPIHSILALLRPAQVLLVSRRGFVSDAIRSVTASAWSHVALLGFSGPIIILLESTTRWRGVAAVKAETTFQDPTVQGLLIRDAPGFSEELRHRVIAAAWLQTGDQYDQGVNVDILWKKATGWSGVLQKQHAKNCAEMVTRAFFLAGVPLLPRLADPTPQAFAETAALKDVWRWDAPAGAAPKSVRTNTEGGS